MGRDASIYIPDKYSKKEITDFLISLGYEKEDNNTYVFFDYKTNTTLSGVAVMISKFKNEYYEDKIFKKSNINYSYSLWVRTTAMGNSYDIEMQNNTLKECRKRFNTFFVSDRGKNRYYEISEEDYTAGLQNAIDLIENTINGYLIVLKRSIDKSNTIKYIKYEKTMYGMDAHNRYLNLVYLCSIIEYCYKSIYAFIFKFSNEKIKNSIIRNNNKLYSEEVLNISSGKLTLEEVVVKNKSFQNIEKICLYFKDDLKLDIMSVLKKPYLNNVSVYNKLEELLKMRNEFVHDLYFDFSYSKKKFENDIDFVREAIRRTFKFLDEQYKFNRMFSS